MALTLEQLMNRIIDELYAGLTGGSADLPLPQNMQINWIQPGLVFDESAFDWAIAGPFAGPTPQTLPFFRRTSGNADGRGWRWERRSAHGSCRGHRAGQTDVPAESAGRLGTVLSPCRPYSHGESQTRRHHPENKHGAGQIQTRVSRLRPGKSKVVAGISGHVERVVGSPPRS